MCKGSWTDYNLKCKQENARSFVKLYAHPQPLRHCVPPPLAQGRLEDFAPCHLPLHRGDWKSLLRATSPCTGEAGGVCSVPPPLTGEAGGVYCVPPPLTGEARRCCESARSDGRASRTALGLIFRYDFFEKSWRQAEKDGILRR